MKKLSLILSLTALLLAGCTTDAADEIASPDNSPVATADADASLFPENDGSKRISSTNALGLCQLMMKFDPSRALTLGETQITDAQFAEIKQFVDENLADASSTYNTYRNIFDWIYKNMTYASTGTAYLDPYDVFTYKRCICQGYANLLKTMCLTQQIPAFCVNGQLSTIGGHAWNYVYIDDTWYVSDPTNNQEYKMSAYSSYQKMLIPNRTDLNLFEDEHFAYNYYEGHLNVAEMKSATSNYISVPYGVEGFRITQFFPQSKVPAGITQLYLGKNIESLGTQPESMNTYMPELQEVFVSTDNTRFSSDHGIVYKGVQTTPHFVPTAIRSVHLKGMKVVDKNTLYDLPEVEEIYVSEATERIEAYAFELCPKLKYVYVPESVQYIDDQALYRCNAKAQIVRTSTGIREVTM